MTQPAPTRDEIKAALARKQQLEMDASTDTEPAAPNPAGPPMPAGATPPEYTAFPGGSPTMPRFTDISDRQAVGRAALNAASGGATDAVAAAVKGAPKQAAGEVTGEELEVLTPEKLAELQAKARGGGPMVIDNVTRETSRTGARGKTGKDPAAVRAALGLSDTADSAALQAQEQQQAADTHQYESLREVQQNEKRATKEFKAREEALQSRYQSEREQQMSRLGAIQKAMDAVPSAPRTIREKLDRSGTSDRIAFGIAAGLSVLGSAMMKDGGQGTQTFLKTVQGNIDRVVQKEADEYARLGERAKMSNNLMAHLRTAVGDDRAAQNVVKAMYYDAAANAVDQIATQYKLDSQAPAVMALKEHLMRERAKLIMDTAATLQQQTSSTSGVSVGKPQIIDPSTETNKATEAFGKDLEARGYNMHYRASQMYQQAIKKLQSMGLENDETFWKAVAAYAAKGGSEQAALDLLTDPNEKEALQLIVGAGQEQLKALAGSNVTANELTRDMLTKGGYSIKGLDTARQLADQKAAQIYRSTAAGYSPDVQETYSAREQLLNAQNTRAGIAGRPRPAVTKEELAAKIEGRLKKK